MCILVMDVDNSKAYTCVGAGAYEKSLSSVQVCYELKAALGIKSIKTKTNKKPQYIASLSEAFYIIWIILIDFTSMILDKNHFFNGEDFWIKYLIIKIVFCGIVKNLWALESCRTVFEVFLCHVIFRTMCKWFNLCAHQLTCI